MHDEDLVEDIAATIEHHCPTSCDSIQAKWKAIWLLDFQTQVHEAIGESNDVEKLNKIADQLKSAAEGFVELSETSKRIIDRRLPIQRENKSSKFEEYGDVTHTPDGKILIKIPPYKASHENGQHSELTRLNEYLGTINDVIQNALREKPFVGGKISNKRKHNRLAAAAACKKIWRDELQAIHKATNAEGDAPEPNKYHHPDYNDTPMIKFMKEIFLAIGLKDVNLSSVLNALENLGGEEALIFSIEVR